MDSGMFIQLSEKYVWVRKLSDGIEGDILLCRDKSSGLQRAVEVLEKSFATPQAWTSLLEAVPVLKQLDHPNIMKLYDFFEDEQNYYMVYEVYKGDELFDEISDRKQFTEADAANTMRQVLSGVSYLHKHKIVHRDLKPESLLFESKEKDALLKIGSLGASSKFDPNKEMKTRLGTPFYVAPEVLEGKYDEKCDEWSCGVILYILLCGYPPFQSKSDEETLDKVKMGKFQFLSPEWDNISSDAKDLISKLLTFEPSKRISAEACLQHPWIVNMAETKSSRCKFPLLETALRYMKDFQPALKLTKAAVLISRSKFTTKEETEELTQIFRSLDSNGDGMLDRNEIVEGYKKMLKVEGEDIEAEMATEQIKWEVDKTLQCVKVDKNGFIKYSEFVTVAVDQKTLLCRSRLQKAFNMFDQDGSGKIAAGAFPKIMPGVGDEQWAEIIREVDSKNDGEVDFEEFVALMQKLHW